MRPITSLSLHTDSDFFAKIQRELDGKATDYSKNGIGYLVFIFPNQDPEKLIFRSGNVFREESPASAEAIYVKHRRQFTDARTDWNLYLEGGQASERYFISYKGVRFETNHGIPIAVITYPDIFIGVLKGNVFVVLDYSSYRSVSNYVETINGDVLYMAGLLAKSGP